MMHIAKAAVEAYQVHPAELKSSDRALLSFARTLQFRHEAGCRCQGQPSDILQMAPDALTHAAGPSESGSGEAGLVAPSSPGTMMTGQDGVKQDDLEARRKMSFEDFLKEPRTAKNQFWEGDVTDLVTLDSIVALQDSTISVSDPVGFLKIKAQWQAAQKVLTSVPKFIKQAADDLTKHMKLKIAAANRDKKRRSDQESRDALKQIKADAAAAAEAIKKRKLAEEQKVSGIFTLTLLPADLVPEIAPMRGITGPNLGSCHVLVLRTWSFAWQMRLCKKHWRAGADSTKKRWPKPN